MSVNGVAALDLPHPCGQRGARGGRVESRPLANLPVVKDLAVDMREFFDKWARARGPLCRAHRAPADFVRGARRHHPARQTASAGIECIGCGVCYAACDMVALAARIFWARRAQPRLDPGQRRARRRQCARLDAVAGDAGCHACHSEHSCVERCPKAIDPTAGIAGLKRATAAAAWHALFRR